MSHLELSAELCVLRYARPFGIARWTHDHTCDVLVRVRGDGHEGWGEGAPNARYDECAAAALEVFHRLPTLDAPHSLEDVTAQVSALDPAAGQAARAALDGALCDWLAKRHNSSLAKLLSLPAGPGPVSSYSIGLSSPEELHAALAAAQRYPLYKVKLSADATADTTTLAEIRARTNKPLRADANEAWPDREQALTRIEALTNLGASSSASSPSPLVALMTSPGSALAHRCR